MHEEKRFGRPATGSGGHHVRLSRSNTASWRFLIGKELWRGIGSPGRVSLSRHARRRELIITPTTDEGPGTYAITGAAGGVPRLTVGGGVVREELRLYEPVVFVKCAVDAGTIIVQLP